MLQNICRYTGDHPPRASVLCVPLPSRHPKSLIAITRMSSDEVQMKMSYQFLTIRLSTGCSDHNPTSNVPAHLCMTNWNVSDQYPTKLFGNEKSAFRPATGLCGRGHKCMPPGPCVMWNLPRHVPLVFKTELRIVAIFITWSNVELNRDGACSLLTIGNSLITVLAINCDNVYFMNK